MRIASPYRLRAARFDHVFVASLQDGEFPRRDRGGDPFLSDEQRAPLGLARARDTEAEERYLFHVCLSLPDRGLFLSYRDSDENGGAEARSPLLDDVRRLLDPPPPAEPGAADPLDAELVRGRGLGELVFPPAAAPSETELARSLAARGEGQDHGASLAAAPHKVVGELDWNPDQTTTGGGMHGGALMSLADTVGAVCAFLNLPPGAGTSTTSSSTVCLRVGCVPEPLLRRQGRCMWVVRRSR